MRRNKNPIEKIRQLIFSTGLFEVSHALTLLSGALFILWIGFFYSVEQVGVFGIWITASLLLSQLAAFGFHNAIISFGTDALKTDKITIDLIYRRGVLCSLVAVLLVAIACVLFLLNDIFLESATFTLFLILNILVISQSKLLVARCNVLDRARTVAYANFLRAFILVIFVCVSFAMDFGDLPQLKFYFGAEVGFLLALILLSPRLGKKDHLSQKKVSVYNYFRRSAKYAVNNLAFDATSKIDLISVSILLPIDAVGIYTMVMNVSEGFFGFCLLKRGQFFDKISLKIRQGRTSDIQKFLKKQYVWFSVIMLPTFFAGYIYIAIISKEMDPQTATALALNLVAILALSPSMLLYNLFFSLQMSSILTLFIFLALLSNVLLNLILIPKLGITGAAIGTLISFSLLSFCINNSILKTSKERQNLIKLSKGERRGGE